MHEDFASELDRDLEARFAAARDAMQNISKPKGSTPSQAAPGPGPGPGPGPAEAYDDMYFDTDEEDAGAAADAAPDAAPDGAAAAPKAKKKAARKKLSNDELFYDPAMDDEDAAWVARQRQRAGVKRAEAPDPAENLQPTDSEKAAEQNASKGLSAAPLSDAILNCPACLSVVCLDCQQ